MLGVSEQALGGIFPLGFGVVVEDKPSELSCVLLYVCDSRLYLAEREVLFLVESN